MEINQELITNSTAIFAAIGAVVFGAQKAIKAWSADRGDIAQIGIASDLYTRMNAELTRLARTNQEQEIEITDLRNKCVKISEDFAQFKLDSADKSMQLIVLKQQLIECSTKVIALQQVNIENGAK